MELAAIYARISDDAEGRAAGVRRQVEDATALAERMGWTVSLPPFVDNDISASTRSSAKRPAFEEMIAKVESGEVDAIAYYSSSRLTRRPMEFETIIELVERTGVRLASVVSGNADLTTADGRMIARILAAQDAAEAERTGERVKRAFAQRRGEGKPNPSSRAFGFEKGGYTVNEGEAALIREAAHRVIHESWSMGEVIRDWNERGIPTVRGARGWSRAQVRRALLSPRTAGLVTQHGEVVGKAAYEAILTVQEQEEVAKALAMRRQGQTTTYRQRRNLLAGFLVCGRCHRPVKVNVLLNEDGTMRKDSFVVCSRSQYGCGGLKRNLPMLMEFVDDLVRIRLESFEPVSDEELEEADAEAIAALERELGEVEDDLGDLQRAFEAGQMRFKDYNAALSALRTRQEALQAALEQRLARGKAPTIEDRLVGWKAGDVNERRTILASLVDHITLLPIGRVGPVKAREMLPAATQISWLHE